MQRKHVLYLFAILALLVAMVPLSAAAQPAAPNAAIDAVGNEQLPTAADAKLAQNGPAAPPAPPANPAAILFDNGPLVTNPGAGAGGADASAVQTALGLSTFGFGHAISSGFRMADDFTVPAGGWTISTITFYAYQTGSTTTTTIDNVNLQIWNGVPGVGSVVFGDTTTNRLAGSSFSNIYRVTDTALTGSTRPIMVDVVTVNTTLPAGTYWLDWQTGGTLASGPWAPPVSILGQTAKPGSNGLQYNPTTATWGPAIDTGANAQQDLPFVVEGTAVPGDPNANIGPLSLAATQATNTTTQQTLTVGNTGTADLTWTIFEDATGATDLVDWSDNFDSYATGSQLHGQGGWKGWANDPAAGALASSAEARSAPNSADIVGASDLVHEYSGYTSGQWVYTAWHYAPTDMTGVSYFILLNTYDDAGSSNNWSTQVQFDSSQNLVINDGVSGGTLPMVKGQWVEIRVEIDLDANTQAFYYDNQLLFQGTWTEEQSGSGALNIGAVDLFANGASSVFYDDVSLAAPAVAVACDAPADIPWVSLSPTSGTTPAAGSTNVQVTFDSTGLPDGMYMGNLCIDSNDPDPGPGNGTDLVIVPVMLTVEPATAVTLASLVAGEAQSPLPIPAALPMAALPAVSGLAIAAVYALRRKVGK